MWLCVAYMYCLVLIIALLSYVAMWLSGCLPPTLCGYGSMVMEVCSMEEEQLSSIQQPLQQVINTQRMCVLCAVTGRELC